MKVLYPRGKRRRATIKTAETERLERNIRSATHKMGVYGCFEVTIGFHGSERVDYITYDTKGIWRCYEIKVSKQDFHSKAAKSFRGNYNYYVMPQNLYETVIEEIPQHIGVYIGGVCVKKAKKQLLAVDEGILKDSMIRSLFRDSDKLYKAGNEHLIDRLNTEIRTCRNRASEAQREYNRLYFAVMEKYGQAEARALSREE